MPAITFNPITPHLRWQWVSFVSRQEILHKVQVSCFHLLCKKYDNNLWFYEYDQIGGKLPVEVGVSSPNQCHQTHKEISHFWNKTSQELPELSRVVQSHSLLLSVVVLNCHKCQHVHYDINDGMSCLWVNFRQAWLKEDVFSKDQRVSHSFSQGHCKWQGRLLSCSRKRSFGKKRFSFKP